MGARFSSPVQTSPGAHPAPCTTGTGSFPGTKERLGRDADLSPLLVPWSRKGSCIPLIPLWAVRPVQSLSACTRVHFTLPQCLYKGALYLTSVPVQVCTLPYITFQIGWKIHTLQVGLLINLISPFINFNFPASSKIRIQLN